MNGLAEGVAVDPLVAAYDDDDVDVGDAPGVSVIGPLSNEDAAGSTAILPLSPIVPFVVGLLVAGLEAIGSRLGVNVPIGDGAAVPITGDNVEVSGFGTGPEAGAFVLTRYCVGDLVGDQENESPPRVSCTGLPLRGREGDPVGLMESLPSMFRGDLLVGKTVDVGISVPRHDDVDCRLGPFVDVVPSEEDTVGLDGGVKGLRIPSSSAVGLSVLRLLAVGLLSVGLPIFGLSVVVGGSVPSRNGIGGRVETSLETSSSSVEIQTEGAGEYSYPFVVSVGAPLGYIVGS